VVSGCWHAYRIVGWVKGPGIVAVLLNPEASKMNKYSNAASNAPAITQHAWTRMSGRGFNCQTIDTVLSYGRVIHVRGAAIHVIGRKEVEKLARSGVDVRGCEGVQVVCAPDGSAILTVYRNSDFRGLKPRGGGRWH
jgi:hypothetical protein